VQQNRLVSLDKPNRHSCSLSFDQEGLPVERSGQVVRRRSYIGIPSVHIMPDGEFLRNHPRTLDMVSQAGGKRPQSRVNRIGKVGHARLTQSFQATTADYVKMQVRYHLSRIFALVHHQTVAPFRDSLGSSGIPGGGEHSPDSLVEVRLYFRQVLEMPHGYDEQMHRSDGDDVAYHEAVFVSV
jgi:hypothetical protein